MNWPFMKFYTRDWQSDPGLRMCSLEARGFWFECLCIMHNAKRRGYLETQNGHPLNEDQTARLMATFKGDVIRCSDELILNGVPSVEDGTGIWYCRRMVKETAKSEKCSIAGKKGGGSPKISNNTEYQIPDTRNHISLKVTFKGRSVDLNAIEGIPEEAYILAAMLATSIARKDPELIDLSDKRFNGTMNEWSYAFKKLGESGRTWKVIKDALLWAMDHKFWGSKMTTAEKFCNNFSDILIQSKENATNQPTVEEMFR